MREEIIGDCRLILGDCRDFLPNLLGFGAVVTDPPYGIGEAWGKAKGWQGSCGKGRLWNGDPGWDVAPDADLFRQITQKPAIIWGGNYFPSLPTSKSWLIWDKCADMVQAHAELAWTNCAPSVRIYRKSPLGAFGNGGKNGELKNHPTQKPIGLMEWCLEFVPDKAKIILDPFMGSGTTGVACVNLRKAFIGIESDESYFDIACRRIEKAYEQPRLFAEPVVKAVQESLL